MITHHGGIAIDFSQIKAIKTEFLTQGGNLIFEFNNIIEPVLNEETGDFEMKSFANNSVAYYFEDKDMLRLYFQEWVEMWEDYKKNKH